MTLTLLTDRPRTFQQSAVGPHTHVSTDVSDSTTVGRSVLTAADAPTARTAINAQVSGSYSSPGHTHVSTDITDATTIGKALLTASNAAAGRTTLSVPLGTNINEVQQITSAAYTTLGAGAVATTLYVIQG